MLGTMKRSFMVLLVIVVTVSVAAQTVEVLPTSPAARAVKSLVDADGRAVALDLHNAYAPTAYNLLWTRNSRPTPQALATIAQLENAAAKGLDAADYDGGLWNERMSTLRGDAALARFDVDLTAAVIRYASDLRVGRIDPQSIEFDFDIEPKKFYAPALVAQVSTSAGPGAIFAQLEPKHDEYRNLIAALAKYRAIAKESQNDVPLPVVNKLTTGDTYAALPQLATTFRRLGDLPADAKVDGTRYEGAIVDAVKHFQSRHGLDADGVVSKKTFAALNVPASQRVKQIEWSLERWRSAPAQFDGPTIVVNIPEFKLHAIDANGELTMRVVVGKADGHKTPVFGGDIKHVVFRPYWSVPPAIQRNEIAPKLARDRGYLARNDFEIVDDNGRSYGTSVDDATLARIKTLQLKVRQKPGSSNALGLMKFLFPNDNNVYLHSTPQQALFSRSRRDFSHGCVRVEDPVALAAWTLKSDPRWTAEKIKAAISGDKNDQYVKLERPVPVVILYATAVASANGDVQFFDDIYGHDAKLDRALNGGATGAVVMAAK